MIHSPFPDLILPRLVSTFDRASSLPSRVYLRNQPRVARKIVIFSKSVQTHRKAWGKQPFSSALRPSETPSPQSPVPLLHSRRLDRVFVFDQRLAGERHGAHPQLFHEPSLAVADFSR